MTSHCQEINHRLNELQNPSKSAGLQRFFKTGPGQYAEGDIFLGINVPTLRKLAKTYADLPLKDIESLLNSAHHEKRLLALLIMVAQHKKSSRKLLHDCYLKNIARINNWDLVDSSAEYLVGAYVSDKPKVLLLKLAQSEDLWERRIAMIATFHDIKQKKFDTPIHIAEILRNDSHDLIHKAVGWMLREIGKRDLQIEEDFLKKYANTMPRTMLRYAIEKFPEDKRQYYLKLQK